MNDTPAGLQAPFSAVAVYDIAEGASPPLAEAAEVVAAIVDPATLRSFFPTDLGSCIEYDAGPDAEEMAKAVSAYELKAANGFGITIIKAAQGGEDTYMPVIMDIKTQQAVVIGPGESGARGGITYVSAEDPAAEQKVNDFLVLAAWERARQRGDSLYATRPDTVIAELAKAFSLAADLSKLNPEGASPGVIRKGVTVGHLVVGMTKNHLEPAIWSAAVKKPAASGM